MDNLFSYPFDAGLLMKKRRAIKKDLLTTKKNLIEKRIAVLGGSTTHDIIDMLELFLLNNGIKPSFYESEFNKYWEDAVFGCPEFDEFKPDIIFIHTSYRNIIKFPEMTMTSDDIGAMLDEEYNRYETMWKKLDEKFGAIIIQNNFEYPFFRLLGNSDVSDIHGRTNFISRMNMRFNEYAQRTRNFFINDINYISASYGLEKWSETFYWHMYKYALNLNAIPHLAHNLANIIKSLYGKNKKSLVLDLDNTMWGGVVGDDGVDGIQIGHETSMGQVYSEFQEYLKLHKQLGVILNVNSKNDYDNAIEGLNHPEGTLKPDDFIVIKANWNNKDANIIEIAQEIGLLPESFVFIDDNPVERGIVRKNIPGISVPEVDKVENYINILDKNGYFEVTGFSDDDIKRNEMYRANAERLKLESNFENYHDYLVSLEMKALIKDFDSVYIQRIAQLTNKSNQFNLTTKRFSQSDMEKIMDDESCIRLYGKLEDKYGDNGVISVVIGKKDGKLLHIDLWLMSCRVLKRDMECAMLDRLVEEAQKQDIHVLRGYYIKSPKNNMVKDFYRNFGFLKVSENEGEDSVWELNIDGYVNKNTVIKVVKNDDKK